MKVLQKKAEKDFVILNLTDPQLDDVEWEDTYAHAPILIHTVTELINTVKPDLITVSGDLACHGEFVSYRKFIDLMDSFEIPWAPVFGNHDHSFGNMDETVALVALLKTSKYCLFEEGERALGIGNYILRIEENGKPLHAIYMMDTHETWDWIEKDGTPWSEHQGIYPCQLEWYAQTVDQFKAEGGKESTLIMHIPTYSYNDAVKAAVKEGTDMRSVPSDEKLQDCWNPGYEDSVGVCHEGIGTPDEDDGFLELLLEKGNTKTILVGHQHHNNLITRYRGITHAYSLKTGRGCDWEPDLSGGTVLTIDGNGTLTLKHHYVDASSVMKK